MLPNWQPSTKHTSGFLPVQGILNVKNICGYPSVSAERSKSVFVSLSNRRHLWESVTAGPSPHLINADFCLHILESFLQDGDESSRGH